MPKPDDDRPQPEPLPVRPPTLPPDFPGIPQNPSSELQPPPDPSATPIRLRARRLLRLNPKLRASRIPRQKPRAQEEPPQGLNERLWQGAGLGAPMVTISITAEAYAGIRSMLPKGVRTEPRLHEGGGGFKITLDRHALDRLAALRGPGESNSDVIVRLTSSGEPR